MSRRPTIAAQPWAPTIFPSENDILCGRGVHIASYPGNERFRTLVRSRYDPDYCAKSSDEKKSLGQQIMHELQSLNPPGRFLRRPGRAKNTRGLEGPWEQLSATESLKKTCQALRDCNRPDRSNYGASVASVAAQQAVQRDSEMNPPPAEEEEDQDAASTARASNPLPVLETSTSVPTDPSSDPLFAFSAPGSESLAHLAAAITPSTVGSAQGSGESPEANPSSFLGEEVNSDGLTFDFNLEPNGGLDSNDGHDESFPGLDDSNHHQEDGFNTNPPSPLHLSCRFDASSQP